MTDRNDKKNNTYSFFQENIVFFVCLLFAVVIWMTMKMSESYNIRETMDFDYQLDPLYDFANKPPQTISFDVAATGWSLLKRQNRKTDKVVHIATIPELNTQYIQRAELIQYILEKYNSTGLKIDNLSIDAIVMEFEKRATKIVPIQLIGAIKPVAGYIFKENLTISPREVELSGASTIIDTMTSWRTIDVQTIEIKDKFTRIVSLVPSNRVNLSVQEISIQAETEQITQKQMSIPIHCDHPSVVLVPSVVQVEFSTGISQFSAIDTSQFSFEVVIDSTLTSDNKISPIILKKYPNKISNIRFQPKVVEYLYQ